MIIKLPTSVRHSQCVLFDTLLSILQMVDMRPHRWTDWAIIGPLCTFTREARSMTTWQRSPFWNPVTALPCSLRSPSLLCLGVWNKQSSRLPSLHLADHPPTSYTNEQLWSQGGCQHFIGKLKVGCVCVEGKLRSSRKPAPALLPHRRVSPHCRRFPPGMTSPCSPLESPLESSRGSDCSHTMKAHTKYLCNSLFLPIAVNIS